MFIEWKDEYCIGVARVDAQHRMLIEQINVLYRRMGSDLGPDHIWDLVAAFNRYADTHFSTEEGIAREGGLPLPEFNAHCAEHQAYRSRMEGFREALEHDDRHAPIQLIAYLHNWWVAHILGTDMALGRFLNEKGIR